MGLIQFKERLRRRSMSCSGLMHYKNSRPTEPNIVHDHEDEGGKGCKLFWTKLSVSHRLCLALQKRVIFVEGSVVKK